MKKNTRHSSILSDPIFPADKSASENQQELSASVFIKSDLRLVVDLQNCYKAQQSAAYARKVKLSNLQQMAKTVAYIQENGYDTEKDLLHAYHEAQTQTSDMRRLFVPPNNH